MISESISSSGHGHIVTKAIEEKNTTIDIDVSMNSLTKTLPGCNNNNNQDQQNQTFDSKITTTTAVVNTCDDIGIKKKLTENDYYDVTIKVSDNGGCIDGDGDGKVGRESKDNGKFKNFKTNSKLLSSKSLHFKKILSEGNNLKNGNVYEIDKSHISSKIFEIVFK